MHLLALVLLHLLLQECGGALPQGRLLALDGGAALLLPLCCRPCRAMQQRALFNCIVGHMRRGLLHGVLTD